MRVKLDHADQDSSGALRMHKGMAATRVAERVADELTAGSRDLRARVIEILHLEADVVQT
jgi:hypothetical protein